MCAFARRNKAYKAIHITKQSSWKSVWSRRGFVSTSAVDEDGLCAYLIAIMFLRQPARSCFGQNFEAYQPVVGGCRIMTLLVARSPRRQGAWGWKNWRAAVSCSRRDKEKTPHCVLSSIMPCMRICRIRGLHHHWTRAPRVEVYFHPMEAFMRFNRCWSCWWICWPLASRVKAKVDQWTGITVCVGIAPTKTAGKVWPIMRRRSIRPTRSVVDLMDSIGKNACWRWLMWVDVWGVGRRLPRRITIEGHSYRRLGSFQCRTRKPFEVSFWVMERNRSRVEWGVVFGLECVRPTKQQIIWQARHFGHKADRQARTSGSDR